ncbi:hypothetical protein UPYG_G00191210 [Umbra pygmaea]|uniref:EGF-like domain-containing protein n=1 Tax=Umbra pygmaea TaxID=75934 RepID=A0ABD0XHY3_UMBPY
MRNPKLSVLLLFFGLLLVGGNVHGRGVHSSTPSALTSLAFPCEIGTCPITGKELSAQLPRVERLMFQKCNSSVEDYCLNGECFLLLDNNEHHCKCKKGYYGPRCAHLEMVFQPMGEEHIIVMVVFVVLLLTGIAGAVYFFCRWYKRNRCPSQQKHQLYHEVPMV